MSAHAESTLKRAAAQVAPSSEAPSIALSAAEQRVVTRQIALALIAGGLLALSVVWSYFGEAGEPLSQVLAGLASLIVAGPVFTSAWRSLKRRACTA